MVEGIIFSAPLLVIRAHKALVSVPAEGKDEGDPTLARPVKRPAKSRSVSAAEEREGPLSQRFLIGLFAGKVIRQAFSVRIGSLQKL
jgi:hypothetical protein